MVYSRWLVQYNPNMQVLDRMRMNSQPGKLRVKVLENSTVMNSRDKARLNLGSMALEEDDLDNFYLTILACQHCLSFLMKLKL